MNNKLRIIFVSSIIVLLVITNFITNVTGNVYKNYNSVINQFDFLIISPLEFIDELEPLAEHKNSLDIQTKLVSLDEIYEKQTKPLAKYYSQKRILKKIDGNQPIKKVFSDILKILK